MPGWLSPSLIKAVLDSLVRDELAAYRNLPPASIPDQPAMDSLEQLYVAASVAEFFCLGETGVEDRLLVEKTADAWSALIYRAIAHTSGLMFRTSGSTGKPQAFHHRWEAIEAEAQALHARIGQRRMAHRVIAWLPLHHLYGFMLGVAYPAVNQLEQCLAGHGLPALTHGDVVVTVPPRWEYLSRARARWPSDVLGVSSTAMLPAEAASALSQAGLAGMLEIYGSTETGGVASRWEGERAFTLLDHWVRLAPDRLSAAGQHGLNASLPDRVAWQDDRRFILHGRHDDQVSIAGTQISPQAVARELEARREVRQCTVRVTWFNGQARLKAFIVPDPSCPDIATAIEAVIARWPAARRPVSITYGERLPVNAMGKLADW